MRSITRRIFWALLGVVCLTAPLAAADVTIHGTVTDNSGKPVRGAMVKATLGDKLVARFTQNDGTYQLTVHPWDL